MKILLLATNDAKPQIITPAHIEKIKAVDSSVEVNVVFAYDQNAVQNALSEAHVVLGVPRAFPNSFAFGKNLKWIHSFSAGMDKILTPEVKASSLLLTNSSGIAPIPIAEHVIGFMLIFARKFYDAFRKQQQKIWERNQDIQELRGKTVAIIGFGRIGKEVAHLAHCMGMYIIAVDEQTKEKGEFAEELHALDQLGNVLSKADFVVVCLPYTKETHHFFNMEKFKKMKPTAIFINIGRGKIAHEAELIEALKNKIIAGAALDVTEQEPLEKESLLWEMENVVITPHQSGWSEKYMERAIDLFCVNLKAYLKGERLPNLVDKEKGY